MTRPRIGDVVATSSGKLYRIRHTTANGRHCLWPYPWTSRGRATWARHVTFVSSSEAAEVHGDAHKALLFHKAGDDVRTRQFLDRAASSYRAATARGDDDATTLIAARDALNDAAGKLAILDFTL